ncbi:MAG: hypothetical protein ACLFV7_00175 [Phycisphaerae bacterium]
MTSTHTKKGRSRRHGRAKPLLLGGLVVALSTVAIGCARGCGEADPLAGEGPAATTQQAAVDPLIGRWEGQWNSDGIHGSGKLLSAIRKTGQGEYLATFVAKFGGGLFTHRSRDVVLTVTSRQDGRWEFKGQKDLGMLNGGMYTYTGSVDQDRFTAKYESSFDTGEFRMERIGHDTADPLTDPNETSDS